MAFPTPLLSYKARARPKLPFTELLQRFRLDVFEAAARNDIDLVFTHNSVRPDEESRQAFVAFAESVRDAVESAQGRVVFVQLTAPPEVLRARVSDDSRRAHGKLVDPGRLDAKLAGHEPRALHDGDLVIDTASIEPAEAAAEIARHLGLPS